MKTIIYIILGAAIIYLVLDILGNQFFDDDDDDMDFYNSQR